MSSGEETNELRERVFAVGAVVRELTRGRTPLRMSAEEQDLEKAARDAQAFVNANAKEMRAVRSRLASVHAVLARRASS